MRHEDWTRIRGSNLSFGAKLAHFCAPFLISGTQHQRVAIGDSNHKGNVAELKILAAAADLGLEVSKPLTEHCRYDLVFDVAGHLLRVQCKWARKVGGVVSVNLSGCSYNSRGEEKRRTYSRNEIDAVAAYCGELGTCYLVPIDMAAERRALHLRLSPARNGQTVAINWAADYELQGAVDQLVDRLRGTQKAVGSSPSSSTSLDQLEVGSEELRKRLGPFMHRAAVGETFHVTRRGKPFCRLTPPESLLEPQGGESAEPVPSPGHRPGMGRGRSAPPLST